MWGYLLVRLTETLVRTPSQNITSSKNNNSCLDRRMKVRRKYSLLFVLIEGLSCIDSLSHCNSFNAFLHSSMFAKDINGFNIAATCGNDNYERP